MRDETVLALIRLEEQREKDAHWRQGSLCLGRDMNPEQCNKSCPPDRKVVVVVIRAYFIVVRGTASIKEENF